MLAVVLDAAVAMRESLLQAARAALLQVSVIG